MTEFPVPGGYRRPQIVVDDTTPPIPVRDENGKIIGFQLPLRPAGS